MLACLSCGSHEIVTHNSSVYCQGCGTVQEESQIVSDVTFGENSAGGAVVQGSYVSAGQSHVRSSNPRFRSGGAGESREQTMSRARDAIQRMGRGNRVSTSTCEKALRWFNLALDGVPEVPLESGLPQPRNYILGRKQEYTVAACLYVACRYAKTSHLLIDFAETIDINVFSLGRHYLKLVAALNLKLPVIDPSFYILRFASLLDFGDETNKVAQDATRLCARFKKDWLGDGRRPAGICGAALLLAARMNNFQRSMNEIVQVVKMADVTIRQRLEEFKRTPTGRLSVQDFKEIWLEEEHEPPAFYRLQLEEEKRKRARAERLVSRSDVQPTKEQQRRETTHLGIVMGASREDENTQSSETNGEDEAQAHATGGVFTSHSCTRGHGLTKEMDALVEEATRREIDQYTQDEDFQRMAQQAERKSLASQQRARKGTRAIMTTGIVPSDHSAQHAANTGTDTSRAEQTALDHFAGQQSDQHRGETSTQQWQLTGKEHNSVDAHSHQRRVSEPPSEIVAGSSRPIQVQKDTRPNIVKDDAKAPPSHDPGPLDTLSDLDEDELDQFILGQDEVRIKERVWMEFNQDYLQDALQRRLKEEADTKAGVFKKRGVRRKNGRRAAVRDSKNPRGITAEEATKDMLLKKKTSKKLNYYAIGNLFSGQRGAAKYGATSASPECRVSKRSKRRKREEGSSGEEDGGEEIRQAVAVGLLADGLGVQEEPGDAVPTTHPLYRQKSKAERANKAWISRQRSGGTSGDESGSHNVGAALTDGATIEGEGGDVAEALSWQHLNHRPYFDEEVDEFFD